MPYTVTLPEHRLSERRVLRPGQVVIVKDWSGKTFEGEVMRLWQHTSGEVHVYLVESGTQRTRVLPADRIKRITKERR